jgi:hypothetical protein
VLVVRSNSDGFLLSLDADGMRDESTRGDEDEWSFSRQKGEETRARRTLSTPSRGHRAGRSAPRMDTAFDDFARSPAASAAAPTSGEYRITS